MRTDRPGSSCSSKLFANCSQSFNRLNLKPKLIPYSEDRSYASFSIAAPSSSSSIRNRRRNPGMHGEKVWTSWVSAGLFVWHPARAREIPVLLRRYNKLGSVLLDFKVDPEFSNALDGWIVLYPPRRIQRCRGAVQSGRMRCDLHVHTIHSGKY